MPLGFPVVPEEYMTYSGCSESNASGVCSGEALPTTSCHHRSVASSKGTYSPVRRTTRTWSTGLWLPSRATAASTAGFSGDGAPRR